MELMRALVFAASGGIAAKISSLDNVDDQNPRNKELQPLEQKVLHEQKERSAGVPKKGYPERVASTCSTAKHAS